MNRKLFASIIFASIIAFAAIPARAQTNAPGPLPSNFLQQAALWVTTQDTNSTTFVSDKLEFFTAMTYKQGLNIADVIAVDYNLTPSIYAEGQMVNAGINGIIAGGYGGVGYQATSYDVRFQAGINGGCDKTADKWQAAVAPYIGIEKAMTKFTFAGFRLGLFYGSRTGFSDYPTVQMQAGFRLH